MDSSRRAVEAYWRSRMVDGVTADEDKVAPVYKLEEVCELLRTSHVSIVKEVSDYILKRLDHKSPIVKQKALRLIKYAVGKSGTEFRREMQRHSAAMRQLFHYKGQLDPLKADALNKAVRDTAHEAISAIFASEDSKVATPAEGINKRIQGFGNTNFEMPMEDKKSFLSEVVGLGSASIKQGLSTIAAAHSTRKTDIGSYKSPTLRRSLTTEVDSRDYEGDSHQRESWVSSGVSKNAASGTWTSDPRSSLTTTAASEDSGSSHTGVKTREERLLETVVTSGGVRLQPTRDVIHAFLTEASKLDAISMSRALEMKLQSHLWQVRMKAICVLESILRKKDDEHFSIIASYFSENNDAVVKCSELPQVSLREKANKVLSLLDGDQASVAKGLTEEPSDAKELPVSVVQMPDLIDTGDPDDYGCEASTHNLVDQRIENLTSTGSLVDDLFGSGPNDSQSTTGNEGQPDPFADVSFHVTGDKEPGDIFSGLKIDDKRSDVDHNVPAAKNSEFFDFFSDSSEQLLDGTGTGNGNMNGLIADLSLNGMAPEHKHSGAPGAAAFSGATILDGSSQPGQLPAYGTLNGLLGSNTYPLASMQYNMPPNIMLNQAFAAQPVNYGAMGAFIAQQQLLLQNLGSLNSGFGHAAGNFNEGASALPDIFHRSNNPVQSQGTMMNSSKKEETKAFDFIADHVSAARDSKRVL